MSFPVEVWMKIVAYCSAPVLLSLRATCTSLAEIVEIDSVFAVGNPEKVGNHHSQYTRLIIDGHERVVRLSDLENQQQTGLNYWLCTTQSVSIYLKGSEHTEAPQQIELLLQTLDRRSKGLRSFYIVSEPINDLSQIDSDHLKSCVNSINHHSFPQTDIHLTVRWHREDKLYDFYDPEIVNVNGLQQVFLGEKFSSLSINMFVLQSNFWVSFQPNHRMKHIDMYAGAFGVDYDCDNFIRFLKPLKIQELRFDFSVHISTRQQLLEFTSIPIERCIISKDSFFLEPMIDSPAEWPVTALQFHNWLPNRFLKTFKFPQLKKLVFPSSSKLLFRNTPAEIRTFFANLDFLQIQWDDWVPLVTLHRNVLDGLPLKHLVIEIGLGISDEMADLDLIDVSLLTQLTSLSIRGYGNVKEYGLINTVARRIRDGNRTLRRLDMFVVGDEYHYDRTK